MTRRIGRGGRKGQTHSATPSLRSYSVPPASAVTVTRADGSTEIVPAQKAQRAQRSPKRGPRICAVCADPITDSKPRKQVSAPVRSAEVERGDWLTVPCTQCLAQPGKLCTRRYSDESAAEVSTPHRERIMAAKKALRPR